MYINNKKDNALTYGIMFVSTVGYLFAKRGGYLTGPYGVAFIMTPLLSMMHSREVDTYYVSENTKYWIFW